jgi:hypothetical protein
LLLLGPARLVGRRGAARRARAPAKKGVEATQRSKGETIQQAQVHAWLYQALETELGGRHISQTALQCAINADLTHQWQAYLEQTETHAQIFKDLFVMI